MIFGGIANSIYGSPRQTFDIGIKISVPAGQEQTDLIDRLRAVAILLPQDPLRFIAETNDLPVTITACVSTWCLPFCHLKSRPSKEACSNSFSHYEL
jgi:hypothetical protein